MRKYLFGVSILQTICAVPSLMILSFRITTTVILILSIQWQGVYVSKPYIYRIPTTMKNELSPINLRGKPNVTE